MDLGMGTAWQYAPQWAAAISLAIIAGIAARYMTKHFVTTLDYANERHEKQLERYDARAAENARIMQQIADRAHESAKESHAKTHIELRDMTSELSKVVAVFTAGKDK